MGSLRKAVRPVVAVLFTLLALGVFAGPALAAGRTTPAERPVAARELPSAALASSSRPVNAASTLRVQAAPTTTAPNGTFNQQVQNANDATAKHKLAVGIAAVVLAVIVYFGRRIRNRHARRLKNLQNAKG